MDIKNAQAEIFNEMAEKTEPLKVEANENGEIILDSEPGIGQEMIAEVGSEDINSPVQDFPELFTQYRVRHHNVYTKKKFDHKKAKFKRKRRAIARKINAKRCK